MKLMIASDIHGSAYYCRKLLEAYDREMCIRDSSSNDAAGCFPAKSGLFLDRCDRGLIKVHQRCHSCKEDCGEEEDGDQPSARHGTDQVRQEDK